MRVLMTTTGYAGHFLPLVPFARAFIAAGHGLRVAAPRSRGPLIERTGLEHLACRDPAEEDLGRIVATISGLSQREGHERMMSEGFADIAARAVLPDVVAAVDAWKPDVLVHESQEYAGPLAAERAGVPHVRVALGLSEHDDETLAIAAATVDELRRELGLPGDPRARALRESPGLTLTPTALERHGSPQHGATHRFRPSRNAAGPLPAWWAAGDDPLIYVTFGSVTEPLGLFPRVYHAAIEPLARLRARILVTIGDDADPGVLGPLPPNVHVERWVAQEAIMSHVDAVVCHGGYGSTLGALAHGTPVVALPIFSDDQWRNAHRVAEVGAGIALGGDGDRERPMLDGPGPEVFDALADSVEALLTDPGYRVAATRIARAIDELPPVDVAVDVLEAITHPR